MDELTAADKAALAAQDFLDTIEQGGIVTMRTVGGMVDMTVVWETTPAYDEARAELVAALKEFHAEPATPRTGEAESINQTPANPQNGEGE